MAEKKAEPTAATWVPVSLIGRKVLDVDGDLVTLEFTLAHPDDKAWYQCFAQARGPARSGSPTFETTNPQFETAERLTWKVELSDIPQVVNYLLERINEANVDFRSLLERKDQIRLQLEEAARRREQAIADAQRILDDSWPSEPEEEGAEETGTDASSSARPQSEQVARSLTRERAQSTTA